MVGVADNDRVTIADIASRVMSLAQDGDPEAALDLARRTLDDHEGTASSDLAALWYGVSVAEHTLGHPEQQIEAATRCLAVADQIDSPGWASNALSVRAMARARSGDIDAAMADLAVAEADLDGCDDEGLAGWAHTGLGYCYDQLRLYELAQPHFEAALAGGANPIELPESRVIDLLNLAEMHLRWADELSRVVPTAATEQDIERQRTLGLGLSQQALQVSREIGLPTYVRSSERLDLCLRAESDPAAVVDDLRAAVDDPMSATVGSRAGGRAQVATALARALCALGDLEGAVQAARVAVESSEGPVDWQIKAAARHLLVDLQAQCDMPGAVDGREYGRLLSEVLWAQRLRTLQGARAARDMERVQRAREVAERAAREDPLTGLANRRAFDEVVQRLAEPGGHDRAEDAQPYSLLLVDLDSFKEVNDTYGHLVGDIVLRKVAGLLRSQARSNDLLVRLGGDEFLVFAAVDADAARELAVRLRQTILGIDWSDTAPGLVLDVSIGAATTGPDLAVTDLIGWADAEMYRTKPSRRPS